MKRTFILGAFVVWAILNLMPLVMHPDAAPMPLVPQSTDFLVTHLPIAQYVHDSILRDGALPLWNSMLMSGQPFAADPLSGYWYLPNWLTFWQPVPWMFTLLFLLHLVWTGWGLFTLLQAEGVGSLPSMLAALTWMATPRLIGYIGSGQVSMVFAVAWTPWLLLAFRSAARQPDLRRVSLAAVCLAIPFLADVRWGLMGGFFAAAYGLSKFHFTPANLRRSALRIGAGIGLFLLLTAGLTLPLLEFNSLSRRVGMTLQDAGGFSLEPFALLGLIVPPYGMLYELVVYLGWVPLVLALFGAARRKFFWSGAALFAGLYALGLNAFLFPLLVRLLPGISWLRVPARAWFIVAFCVAALAGWGLDGLLTAFANSRLPRWCIPLAAGVAALLTFGNLLWYNASQLSSSPVAPSALNDWLEAQPGTFRVYSPDGSLALPNRLQLANGVNPLHLASYAHYLGDASGLAFDGYSVSLPYVYLDPSTPPDIVRAASWPDPVKLGQLNVKYLVSSFPLQSEGLKWVKSFGKVQIYENLAVQPRAWLPGAAVEVRHWSPNRIELVEEGGAGTLVLSEMAYPGWQVSVDGQGTTLETIDGLLRGVKLEAGKHRVIFEFQPLGVYAGAALAALGWLIVCLMFQPFRQGSAKRTY